MRIEGIRGDDPDHFRIALARASSRARFVLRMLNGVPARVQAGEVRSAVDAEQHGLAIEDNHVLGPVALR
jgi:hypothetical protein